jgi:hypothetical protein
MVHFASRDLSNLPRGNGPEVIRTGGNEVGVLRLVPIRSGFVTKTFAVNEEDEA